MSFKIHNTIIPNVLVSNTTFFNRGSKQRFSEHNNITSRQLVDILLVLLPQCPLKMLALLIISIGSPGDVNKLRPVLVGCAMSSRSCGDDTMVVNIQRNPECRSAIALAERSPRAPHP